MRPISREYDEREHAEPIEWQKMMWEASRGSSVGFGIGGVRAGRGSGVGVGVGMGIPVGSPPPPERCQRTLIFADGRVVEQHWAGPPSLCAPLKRP